MRYECTVSVRIQRTILVAADTPQKAAATAESVIKDKYPGARVETQQVDWTDPDPTKGESRYYPSLV